MPAYSHMGFLSLRMDFERTRHYRRPGARHSGNRPRLLPCHGGSENCDTAKAATLSLGEPLGAAVLGFAVLHEALNLWGLIGIAAIFASVLILVYQPGKKNI